MEQKSFRGRCFGLCTAKSEWMCIFYHKMDLVVALQAMPREPESPFATLRTWAFPLNGIERIYRLSCMLRVPVAWLG